MDKTGGNVARISLYPSSDEITLGLRPLLHPLFKAHQRGISEFTFANIRLFRGTHNYRLSRLSNDTLVITGADAEGPFFMLPFDLPPEDSLASLFKDAAYMKCADEATAALMTRLGYRAVEDRANFDYLYLRSDQAELAGRRFHKKKNLVNAFLAAYSCEAKPLIEANVKDALRLLDMWLAEHGAPGDYEAAKEALVNMEALSLCGGIFYVNGEAAAFILGEELGPDVFVIHFEKGVGDYHGLLQYANHRFAEMLPAKYVYINREQDLADAGLRHSKESYRPAGFVKKFRVFPDRPDAA
ncbi:MAG: DUF2156 domain-containing protein [Deltaproteobacteria bacterium]|nr:DUF2156 domain-containing protein [Deltaproteobacteria bacterium]